MEVIIVGATGLCGNAILKKAMESSTVQRITAFSRKKAASLPEESGRLKTVISSDTEEWKTKFPENASVIFSGIATTRKDAGSLENQRLIDHNLQVELALAAKERGCNTFVLISSAGASSTSMFPYLKMKGETETAIAELGFERTIILRPGPLLGNRDKPQPGFGVGIFGTISSWAHRSAFQRIMGYPVHAEEVANCALRLVNSLPPGVHYIESKDILDHHDVKESS